MIRASSIALVVALVVPALQAQQEASAEEKHELATALEEANTSPFDMIRALEAHLRKYPNTSLRPEIEKLLAKDAVEAKDSERIALYGVPALTRSPNDPQLLDRVAAALLSKGGKENAEKALDYGRRLENYVIQSPATGASDPVRDMEDHDRTLERALLYQSRALGVLGSNDDARKKAALAFMAYAEENSAREWAVALERVGNHEEAIQRMAEAFTISDARATDEVRAADRRTLGEMYRALHDGSETGLGDVILAAYDRTTVIVDKRKAQIRALDPNTGIKDPGKFTLLALEGGKLPLESLRGKVLILDFWATWCVPCRTQHPLYEQVKKHFSSRSDVVFLSVDSEEEHDLVSHFVDEQKWSRMVYFDSGLVELLSVNDIPTTILLDKEGRLVSRMNGFYPDTFVTQLTARIEAVLRGPVQ